MFSFHRPRVYRSVNGCCICRAKSSSSRFTDSQRYEPDFEDCFKLMEIRSGEICNACVLLVKRWKKLPRGSQRNWNHVIDARAGHGSKPMSKINKVKKQNKIKLEKAATVAVKELTISVGKKSANYIPRRSSRSRETSPSGLSDDVAIEMECMSSESGSYHSSTVNSPAPSPAPQNDENIINENDDLPLRGTSKKKAGKGRIKRRNPKKNKSNLSSFLDLNFWKREKTCCGIIFKGPFGEVVLDRRFINPCACRTVEMPSPSFESLPSVTSGDVNSPECFSIDSGYEDDNSNPSAVKNFRLISSSTNILPSSSAGLVGRPQHPGTSMSGNDKNVGQHQHFVVGSYRPGYNVLSD